MLWGPSSMLNCASDIENPPMLSIHSHRQSVANCASLVIPTRQSRSAGSRIASRVFQRHATGFILVLVQKSGDLPAERRCLPQLSDGSGGIEDLPLQRRRQGVPLHDNRRPKTAQNLLFFGSNDLAAGPIQFVNVHGIVISICEAALVIRQRDEAVLQVLISSAFVSISRTLDGFAVLGCFHAILLEFEHVEHFRFEVFAYLNARMLGTISPVDLKRTHRPDFIWPVRRPCRG